MNARSAISRGGGITLAAGILASMLCAQAAGAAAINLMLTGDQEVPQVETSAKGIGVIHVNPDRSVTGSITTSIADATAAHIHRGARGANGPPVVTLVKSGDRWSVPANTRLTEAQYTELLAGKMYVNVHSPAHQDGEIRAQIMP